MLNNLYDKIFVLNLKKDKIKRKHMKEKLDKLNINFDFFDAINGKNSPYFEKYNEYKIKPVGYEGCHINEKIYRNKMIRSPGAWGYIETWVKLLEYVIKMKYKNIVVFDDDVIFDDNFDNKLLECTSNIDIKDTKIVLFGASQHEQYNIHFSESKGYYYPPVYTDGSFASGIDSSVFQELLDHIKKRDCSVDSGAFREIYKKYPNECYVVYPNIIIADVSESSISNGRQNIFDSAKKLRWELDNFSNVWIYLKHTISVIAIVNKTNFNLFDTYIENINKQTYKNIEIIIINNSDENISEKDNIKVYKNILDSPIDYAIQKATGYFINISKLDYKYNSDRFSKEIKYILKNKLCKYPINTLLDNKNLFENIFIKNTQ